MRSGAKPFTFVCRWNIKFRPIWPLALGTFERRASRADSIGLAASMNASAAAVCWVPSPST
jgi:hypothetical protein